MKRTRLFEHALQERWALLPPPVQALHRVDDVERHSGMAQVERGRTVIARVVCACFGFPPAAASLPLTVTMLRTDSGETWERDFAGHVFRSYLTPASAPYRCRERFGWFDFELELLAEAGRLRLAIRRGWFFGLPIPNFVLPTSDSYEYAEDGTFHFDVSLGARIAGGLIVRYRGWLRPGGGASTQPIDAGSSA